MYLATCKCGGTTGLCWDDEGREKSTSKAVAQYIKRGDSVARVARHEGDPMPELCQCAKRTPQPPAPSTNQH
jgi:hypothetical protein